MDEKAYTEIRTQIEQKALSSLSQTGTFDELESWRIDTLGRNGTVTGLLRGISGLPVGSRKEAGSEANSLKDVLTEKYEDHKAGIENSDSIRTGNGSDFLDVTLPGRKLALGSLHPTTAVVREICQVFESMGFQTIEGPEVELDTYNFQK